MINPDYRPLRSAAQIMDDLRAQHPEYLTQIHSLLERAEMLAKRIGDEQVMCTAANNSFEDLAAAIADLRADYLKPADHDLKEWHSTWEPVE